MLVDASAVQPFTQFMISCPKAEPSRLPFEPRGCELGQEQAQVGGLHHARSAAIAEPIVK